MIYGLCEEIVNKVQDQLRLNLPFVLYSKPNSKEVIVFFQKNDSVFEANDFTEKGFIMASFDGAKNYLIPESESEVVYTSLDKKEMSLSKKEFTTVDAVAKSDFETLATNALNDACSLTNPRKGNLEEVIAIFKKAM